MKGKLKVGQVLKNYKDLCDKLGLEIKGGNSKIAQMKEIERYYEFERQKYKYIVKKEHLEPLQKVDGRTNNGRNTNIYDDLMDRLIINTLIDYDGYIEESYTGLVFTLDLFTKEYEKLYKATYKRYSELHNLGVGVTKEYQQHIYNKVKNCIETSLKRLERNEIVEFDIKILIRDKNFNKSLATTIEQLQIKKATSKIYKNKGWDYHKLIVPENNRVFKRTVSKEIGINNYWNVYCIRLLNQNTIKTDENKEELIKRLANVVNKSVRNKIYKNNEGREYKPYLYSKYSLDIIKLAKLMWNLPETQLLSTNKDNNSYNDLDSCIPF